MQPLPPPPKVQATRPPPALPAKVAAALATGPFAKDGTDWAALRQELRAAHALAERRRGRQHPETLTLRGLAGLVLDRQGEADGLPLFAQACGDLHRLWRQQQRAHGPEGKETLPTLEALRDLVRLERLGDGRWEDCALRVAVRHSKGPRPDLEQRAVDAIGRAYGGWLSFRAPDRQAVAEATGHLLRLWARRPAGWTREFLETGLRSDARGVWKLLQTEPDEALREALKAMLRGLDPAVVQGELRGFLAWLPAQAGAPWQATAWRLAEAVDAELAKADAPPAAVLQRRVRLARALGEPARAARMAAAALGGSAEDRGALLAVAAEILREHPDPELLRAFRQALAAELPALARDPDRRELLAGEARRREAEGDPAGAEGIWRGLLAGPSGEPDPTAVHALGCNLAAQQRWDEARFFLIGLATVDKWRADASLRFRLAAVEDGAGDRAAARRWAREGLDLLDLKEAPGPHPAQAQALRLLPAEEPKVAEVLAALRRSLDPEEQLPLLADRTVLLALLEGLEAQSRKPPEQAPIGCDSPWAALGDDPETRGRALLRAADGRRLLHRGPCLRAAIRAFEQAWGVDDPRLARPLLQLGQCLQEQEDAGAEVAYRRALAVALDAPAAEPLVAAEALGRLGQLLAELDREQEGSQLLQAALERLAAGPKLDRTGRELAAGVATILAARLEYREDFAGAQEALERAVSLLARSGAEEGDAGAAKEAGELAADRERLARAARIQALLRAQGLP